MSIQSSINQGVLATAALVSQNPNFQEKKKETAYEENLSNTLQKLSKEGKQKLTEIDTELKNAGGLDFKNPDVLYNQLERFKGFKRTVEDYSELAGSKFQGAMKHYKEKGNLEEYSKSRQSYEKLSKGASGAIEELEGIEKGLSSAYEDIKAMQAIRQTNATLDEAEQTQNNTNSFHETLKNKNKVNVVGDKNGK